MARSAMAGWEERFDDYVERLGDVLGHADRRGPLRAYTTRGQAQDERLQAAAARPAAGCPGRLRGPHQDRKGKSIGVSTTTEVHPSRSGVASGSGGRAADGGGASATRPGRRPGRAPVPRPASTLGAAPPARSAAAAPRRGRAASLPPPATLRITAR